MYAEGVNGAPSTTMIRAIKRHHRLLQLVGCLAALQLVVYIWWRTKPAAIGDQSDSADVTQSSVHVDDSAAAAAVALLVDSAARNTTATIPRIIHLVYDSYDMPAPFRAWIHSLARQHRSWQFWVWRLNDTLCLLSKRFNGSYVSTYQSYSHNVFRADAIRYFVLYEFGGFYIDLDVEALRPLDIWTVGHDCIVTHENYEHTYLVHHKRAPNIMTTVLAARPKHPLFKLLCQNLEQYRRVYPRSVLHATGPFYLNTIYRQYLKTTAATRATSSHAAVDVTVLHPRYWLPRWDPTITRRLKASCRQRFQLLTDHGRLVCRQLEATHYRNSIHRDSFLDHKWAHMGSWTKSTVTSLKTFDVYDVIPWAQSAYKLLNCD